jgi:hypothetical protein
VPIKASIIIPIVLVAVALAVALVVARRIKTSAVGATETRLPNGARLTTNTLRQLPQPPWRVVHEIESDALDGIDHVVLGASGIYAITTSLLTSPAEANQLAGRSVRDHTVRATFVRSYVAALAGETVASATTHVTAVWGANAADIEHGSSPTDGTVMVDGAHLVEWLGARTDAGLTSPSVDLAWSQICMGIGRPDPLAS